MRKPVFKWSVITLLTASSAFFLRPSDVDTSKAGDKPFRQKTSASGTGHERAGADIVRSVTLPASDAKSSKPPALAASSEEIHPPVMDPQRLDDSAQGVRLADDVRLPAVLMPQYDHNPTPAVVAANLEIANTFYRDLQTKAAGSTSAPRDEEAPGNGDHTKVISNTPTTVQIRRLADEQFRALHGDERYTRQTLDSSIEVALPPN